MIPISDFVANFQTPWRRHHSSDILEYDPETKEWTQIGTMMETSWGHGVSVVDFTDYANFCK